MTADALFEAGKERLREGDWKGACEKFQASMKLDASQSTLLKIAMCNEREGKLALALFEAKRALVLNAERRDRPEALREEFERFALPIVAALEARVPRLEVTVTRREPGLQLTRDGQRLPAAAIGEPIPVDPGPHEVEASAPGFRTERRSLVLAEGEHAQVAIALEPEPAIKAAPPAAAPVEVAPPPSAAADGGSPTAGWIVGGVGIVGLSAAAVLGSVTLVRVGDLDDADCPNGKDRKCNSAGEAIKQDARTTQTAALVSLGVGALALGTGIVLLTVAPPAASQKADPSVLSSLHATVGLGSAQIGGTWW